MSPMIKLIKTLLHGLSIFLEKMRGPWTLVEITPPRASIEAMAATSLDGFTTTIHCQERRYLCRHERWYMSNRVVYSYFVFATIQGTASPRLVDACSMERSFPKLLHSWMPSASQKEAAIEAYLDLLIERLKRNDYHHMNDFKKTIT